MNSDIIVIGGGHAGIEAAVSASKYDIQVLLITTNIDLIGQMSCNPAIGGIAKGVIVREIDALGGIMAQITDETAIQYRMLNRTKGYAVWGNRAQADKSSYREIAKKLLEKNDRITLYQDCVTEILVKKNKACGVKTLSGHTIEAQAVVCAMGTFLNGCIHVGMNSFSAGRLGEPPSLLLTESMNRIGIRSGRLKTGTPARIDGRSVDFSVLHRQEGDDNPWPFSFKTQNIRGNKVPCWELKTTMKTHEIIRKNLDKSPLYGGKIKSIGPRYCPSIEDKVVKFGDRTGHTLFLEPEGIHTNEMYLNGFSTSLPFEVQMEMIQSLPGLENATVMKPAYAIEYDYFYPTQLKQTLESRTVENLFCAGQINGTSGYEEAACQGLICGINAARKIVKKSEFILGRETSYTGVLIDDLITKGTEEPYRMFTSRAEYRLLLRQDNADERLMPKAYEAGLLDEDFYQQRKKVWDERKKILFLLKKKSLSQKQREKLTIHDGSVQKIAAHELLKRPQISYAMIREELELPQLDTFDTVTIEADIKYEGFIEKQMKDIEKIARFEQTKIPPSLRYEEVPGLLRESQQKLTAIRPLTVGQASRISGVTPADITVLIVYIHNKNMCD